jgi:prevent-host-death family protein
MKPDAPHIAAGEFKARCLALLDQVCEAGETYVITKRGRPVARLVPVAAASDRPLKGSVVCKGDIVAPSGDDWDADR